MGQGFWRWLSPGGTGYPCRCGKLNEGFPPAHWLSLPLWCPRGACLFGRLSPLPLAYLSAPYPPDPLPRRGRGRPKLFHARGFAPCIPNIRPPAALAIPAAVVPKGGLPFWLPVAPVFSLFVCPLSPRPPSRREGGDQSCFLQGAPPLASPRLSPGGTGSRGGEARPAGYHSGRFCKCRRRFNAGVPGAKPPAK